MDEKDLIEQLRQQQVNGRTSYLTFGELVAMVPTNQLEAWRVVLAKARTADERRNAEEDAE